jgi:hypothetical protein
MNSVLSKFSALVFITGLIATAGCRRDPYSPEKAAFAQGEDLIIQEMVAFRNETRQLYNNRNFEKLETRADDVRSSKAKFDNGEWILTHFYSSLACQKDEPESMWQLHEKIHKDWEEKFPQSITAKTAHADFLAEYAWHARGTGYANEVTDDGWRLFAERLESARTLLADAKNLSPKCPVTYQVEMTVALGQSWKKEEFARLFEEAKALEPTYFPFDLAQAKFLMPRWHGELGDWETAAEKEINRPGGLGLAGYARVATHLRGYYDDFFSESKASWEKTQLGFEQLRKDYPKSAEILNQYARMACAANDRATAKRLFEEIGNKVITDVWGSRRRFNEMRKWAQ